MGLRTDRGLIVLNVVEVLPMVADVLTILSFCVLCMNKLIPVISQVGSVVNNLSSTMDNGDKQSDVSI